MFNLCCLNWKPHADCCLWVPAACILSITNTTTFQKAKLIGCKVHWNVLVLWKELYEFKSSVDFLAFTLNPFKWILSFYLARCTLLHNLRQFVHGLPFVGSFCNYRFQGNAIDFWGIFILAFLLCSLNWICPYFMVSKDVTWMNRRMAKTQQKYKLFVVFHICGSISVCTDLCKIQFEIKADTAGNSQQVWQHV